MQRTAALTRNFVFCKETAMTTTRQDLQRPLIGPSIFWSPCSCPHRAPWALFFSSPQISAHSTQHQKAHGALYFAIDILGRPKDLERAPPAPHRTWLSGSRLQTLHIHTRLKRDLKHARETVSAGRRGSRPRPSNPPGRPRTSPMGVWHVAKSRMLAPQDAVKGRPVVPLFAF